MLVALTRAVSPAIQQCELTHLDRTPISFDLAREQHRGYERCLLELGCRLDRLPADPDLADSVFVEDVAVVVDELAIATRPGAVSRRPEVKPVAERLATYRSVAAIEAPGTLDGGDVLRIGRTLFVGRGPRSNDEGIQQLRRLLEPFDYAVCPVDVRGCLHLKSAVTQVDEDTLLLNPEWVDGTLFRQRRLLDVDPRERYAANALLVAGTAIYPVSFPRTRDRLETNGVRVRTVDVSELQKAEGAVTCCSLVFTAPW
jgi:dimethylargininase